MRVFIEESPGKVITVECSLSDKIKDLKAQVHKKKGYPVGRQMLYKGSTELVDSKTVNECKLGKDAKLVLKLAHKENKSTKPGSTPSCKVSFKSTSCSITVTCHCDKPGKQAIVLSHDDVTLKTSTTKTADMTSKIQKHVFYGLDPSTEYTVQVFTFKETGGKECIHNEMVSTGPSVPEMVVSISEINNILVTWNAPKLGDVSYYELSLYDSKNTSSEIVSFVKSHDEERRLVFRDLEPKTYIVKLCAVLNDDVRSDTGEEDIDTEYFIEVDKIESTKSSATFTWKSPNHDDFQQFEVSLWDATHTERVSEPCVLDAKDRCYTWEFLDPGTLYTCEMVGLLRDEVKRGKVLVQIKTKCEIVITGCKPAASTIDLSWTSPNNQHFTMYEVSLQTMDKKVVKEDVVMIQEANMYSYTFEELQPDTEYVLSVCAVFDDESKTDTVSQKTITEKEVFHLYNLRKHEDLLIVETKSQPWDQSLLQSLQRVKQHIVELHSASRREEDKKDLDGILKDCGDFEQAMSVISKKSYLLNTITEERAWSLLHWAAYHNKTDIIQKLLSFPNCDISIQSVGIEGNPAPPGCTPLDVAKSVNSEEAIKILEEWEALEMHHAQYKDGSFVGEEIWRKHMKVGLHYLLLGFGFVDNEVIWNRLGLWQIDNYLQLTERVFDLLAEEWMYFRNIVSKSVKVFDEASADFIHKQSSSDSVIRAILQVYTNPRIYKQVNTGLQKVVNVVHGLSQDKRDKSSAYADEEISLSLFSLVVHCILLHWPELPKYSCTTYSGVVLKQEEIKNYAKGSEFAWIPFASCSTDIESSMKLATPTGQRKGHLGVLFIHNNGGESKWKPCDLKEFAGNQSENLIYPAGAKFKVTNVVSDYSHKNAMEVYIELVD